MFGSDDFCLFLQHLKPGARLSEFRLIFVYLSGFQWLKTITKSLGGLIFRVGITLAAVDGLADALVNIGTDKTLQYGGFLAVLALQETCKVALSEHSRPAQLFEVHADDALHRRSGFGSGIDMVVGEVGEFVDTDSPGTLDNPGGTVPVATRREQQFGTSLGAA